MFLPTLQDFQLHPNSRCGIVRPPRAHHRTSNAGSIRSFSKWQPPTHLRCQCHIMSGRKKAQTQQNCTNRRKHKYARGEKITLFGVCLLSTVTISTAHATIHPQLRSSPRRMPHKRGDPPALSHDDDAIDDINSDYSTESQGSSDTYGDSAYGDYGAYIPKGNSNNGSGTANSGGKTKAKSGNASSSASSSSLENDYDSYDNSLSSPSSSASTTTHGNDSYFSEWGVPSKSSRFKPNFTMPSMQLSLIPAILWILFVTLVGMLVTAHQMEHSPEGTFANCCRVSLATVSCICKVMYNLYHCRLGDIPQVVFASDFEDDDELTDEELERMKLRPGIERALDVEHRKALRKVGIEMKKIKVVKGTKEKEAREGLSGAIDGSRV